MHNLPRFLFNTSQKTRAEASSPVIWCIMRSERIMNRAREGNWQLVTDGERANESFDVRARIPVPKGIFSLFPNLFDGYFSHSSSTTTITITRGWRRDTLAQREDHKKNTPPRSCNYLLIITRESAATEKSTGNWRSYRAPSKTRWLIPFTRATEPGVCSDPRVPGSGQLWNCD